jgi:hypothetical protein
MKSIINRVSGYNTQKHDKILAGINPFLKMSLSGSAFQHWLQYVTAVAAQDGFIMPILQECFEYPIAFVIVRKI